MEVIRLTKKIAVLGPGSWGTALSQVLSENGHEVRLWGNDPAQIDEINTYHTNRHYLPDLKIHENIQGMKDLGEAVEGVDAILFVVPTNAIRPVARQLASIIKGQPYLIHAAKGLERDSHKRISEVINEEISTEKRKELIVLSGPSHAEEVAVRDITTITAASSSLSAAQYVQDLFMNTYFRIYTNDDVIGVETGAALKNIIAIGAGAISGLGFGDNAKAAIITRGLA